MQGLVAPTINLLILLGVLVYYLRAPIAAFVRERHVTIGDEIRSVRELLGKAQASYDEYSSKLKAIDVEIAALRERGAHEGGAMRTRIIAEAQRLAANIVSDGKAAAQNAFGDLRAQLTADVAMKVLDRAEALLRDKLTGDDRVRIRQEFSTQVVTMSETTQ
jgi:F0F1-type ATP synthase membrane subunit b/b'